MLDRANSLLGLVVGKFAPLHLGHEWLIDQASRRCDRLLILSYSKPEFDGCGAAMRRRGLAARFPEHEALVVDGAWLGSQCGERGIAVKSIPDNDASDEAQQEFLAWLLRAVVQRTPNAMFCSEAYGHACAKVLSTALCREVTAVIVDLDREQMPISGTTIRKNPHEQGHWMAPEVRAAFVSRIALLGGESTGKTSLAAAMGAHYETAWVLEYGTELWEQQSGSLSEGDLLRIGHEQIRREDDGLRTACRYLFCDTSPLITAGYSIWMFGKVDPELARLASRQYDGIILCRPDFPFVQDGTRRDEEFRQRQHAWYQEHISTLRCAVMEAGGTLQQRITEVCRWLRDRARSGR